MTISICCNRFLHNLYRLSLIALANFTKNGKQPFQKSVVVQKLSKNMQFDKLQAIEMEGFERLSALRKIWCHSRPAGHEQQSTGLLHLDWFKSLHSATKKKHTHGGCVSILKEVTCFNTKWTYSCLFVKRYGNR